MKKSYNHYCVFNHSWLMLFFADFAVLSFFSFIAAAAAFCCLIVAVDCCCCFGVIVFVFQLKTGTAYLLFFP